LKQKKENKFDKKKKRHKREENQKKKEINNLKNENDKRSCVQKKTMTKEEKQLYTFEG
jgi:hypothetical protein